MTILSYALVSLVNLKLFMKITSSGQDDRLIFLINQATDYIEKKCQRRFLLTTYDDERYDGNGTKDLILNQYPVVTLTALSKNGAGDNSSSWDLITSTDYWVDLASGIVSKVSSFVHGKQNYRVTYSAGYAADSIPSDLQYVCCMLASEAYSQATAAGIKSETLGDHSITFESTMQSNPRLLEILNNYRKITTAPAC